MMFSFVVPCLNHSAFLGECLESLVSQRDDDVELEIYVIDGGSTDETRLLLECFDDKLTGWTSEPDRGQTHALLKGFARSTGDVMGWLNADDILVPGALSRVARFFEQRPHVDIVYGDAEWIDKQGEFIKNKKEIAFDLDILLWDYCYLPQSSTFWRRSAWERTTGLDETLFCAMDYDLWLKLAASGARFEHMRGVLSRQRIYPEQKNQRFRAISDQEDRLLRERFLSRPIGETERLARKCLHKARRIGKRFAVGAYWG